MVFEWGSGDPDAFGPGSSPTRTKFCMSRGKSASMSDPQKLQKVAVSLHLPMLPPGEPAHQALVAATPLPTSEIRRVRIGVDHC
jgi:hypothetical protein